MARYIARVTQLARLLVPPHLAHLDGRAHFENYAVPFWRNLVLPLHVHRFLQLDLVVRGSAVVVLGEEEILVPTGSLLWMPPGLEHFTVETSKAFCRYNLSMRGSAVRRVLTRSEAETLLGRSSKGRLVAQLDSAELEALADVFKQVAALSPTQPSVFNAGLGYALARAFAAFQSAVRSSEPSTLHPAVLRALALMQRDGLQLSREELAAGTGLSVSYLSRLFVQELGQELREVRNQKRIALALKLLRDGRSTTLLDAALEAGFGSYSQFHRVYTRLLGHSPAQHLGRASERVRRAR